ncbi:MAG: AIR synthase, partial [Firmicutes bacterium]|nr:AIR synthase [Bacillota bacterium]
QVWEDKIPMEPETEKICEFFHIDPLRLISSGSMVIIVPADKREAMEAAMAATGVSARIIGRIEDKEFGIKLMKTEGSEAIDVAPPSADELYRVVGKI